MIRVTERDGKMEGEVRKEKICYTDGFEDGDGATNKESKWPLGTGKGKETDPRSPDPLGH